MRLFSLLRLLLALWILLYLLAPIIVVVGAAFNAGNFLTFPPQGLSLRWFKGLADNPVIGAAALQSLILAATATLLAAPIAMGAALYHARHAGRWRGPLGLLLLLPLILPDMLTGMALLFFFHHIGLGTRFNLALLTGHVLIVLPFFCSSLISALAGTSPDLEWAARSLGAGPWAAFRRVTLPLLRPGLVNGALLSFVVSFDTFGLSFLLKDVGAAPLPLQLFDDLRFNFTPEAAAIATISILLTLIVVIITGWSGGLTVKRF